MTNFVIWQLRVTLDSIRNSCDVFIIHNLLDCNKQVEIMVFSSPSFVSSARSSLYNHVSLYYSIDKTEFISNNSCNKQNKCDNYRMTEHTHSPWASLLYCMLCLFAKSMFKHIIDLVGHILRDKAQSKCQWLTESCIIVCQPPYYGHLLTWL